MSRKAEFNFSSLASGFKATVAADMVDGINPSDARIVGEKLRDLLAKEWGDSPMLVEVRVQVWEAHKIVE